MNYQVQPGTMARALGTALHITPFEFDLLAQVRGVHSLEFKTQLLSTMAFSCDGQIGGTIQARLREHRELHELEGTAQWDNYQAFLAYVGGIAASETSMAEGGMNVSDTRETIQKLFNMRTAIYAALTELRGQSFEVPSIEDFLSNPRPQTDSAEVIAKKAGTAKDFATDDDGVIDMDKLHDYNISLMLKDKTMKAEQLKWDKQRGELSAMLFRAFKIRDDMSDIGYTGEEDPFGDLPAQAQYKLMHGCANRWIDGILQRGSTDRKVTVAEHATWMAEARPLRKSIRAALEHQRFADIGA